MKMLRPPVKQLVFGLIVVTTLATWFIARHQTEASSYDSAPLTLGKQGGLGLPAGRSKNVTAPQNTSHKNIISSGQLPLSFEANQGQTDARAKFVSHSHGCTLFLTATEAVFQWPMADLQFPNENPVRQLSIDTLPFTSLAEFPSFRNLTEKAPIRNRQLPIDVRHSEIRNRQSAAALRMTLVGANPRAQIEGLDRLPGISNYFIGNDPKKWRTNIPNFAKVQYRNVYPGIDLVYYGNQGKLEYDWVVAPGANPEVVTLAFEGAEEIHVDSDGDLVLKIAATELRQHEPRIYQEVNGAREEIASHYVLKGDRQVSFTLASYDMAKELVIDPVLSFGATLPGKNYGDPRRIAVDAARNIYVSGTAYSADFPTTSGAFQTVWGGDRADDAFVTKLNPTGTAVVYATYLGGAATDILNGMAVDSSGNAFVAGFTNSVDFPTTVGSFLAKRPGELPAYGPSDAFVTKLNATGSALLYSTYLGGTSDDAASDIAIDSFGNAYVTGLTFSVNFPVSYSFPTPPGAFQKTFQGGADAFVSKLNPTGAALVYSTYLEEVSWTSPMALHSTPLAMYSWRAQRTQRIFQPHPE